MTDKTKRPFEVITGGKDAGEDVTNIAPSIDTDTMPSTEQSGDDAGTRKRKHKLTGKQLKFARLLVQGDLSQSECYRRSYRAEKMNDATVWRESSLLSAHPIVATMVKQARQRIVDATIPQAVRRQEHVLTQLMAESNNQDSPAQARIRALELLGRVAIDGPALFSERVEVITESESASDIRTQLESRLTALLAHRKNS